MRCPSCGFDCVEPARFCSQCGSRLGDQAASAHKAVDDRSPPERRQLTVMFCDLVESTRLSLELDAEDFANAVSAYRDVCARVVRSWRGYVSRYVGDGVLIYFGYPRVAEDDALRGLAAAWELAHAIPELTLPPTMPRLQARISLHTGLALVGDVVGSDSIESGGALGAVPNIAARLQSLAQPGEVVISDTTAALVPGSVQMQPVQRLAHQRELESVTAYVVTDMPLALVRQRPGGSGVFVGRSALLQRLRSLSAQPERDRIGIFISGEAGIGKSRLMQELIKQPGFDGATWIQLACSAYEQLSPLHPFRDWFAEIGMNVESQPGTEGGSVDVPVPPGGDTPFDRRRRIFAKLHDSIFGAAGRGGLLIEDLHWADSMTLEFIDELLARPDPRQLALLISSREPPSELLANRDRLHVERLERLSPGDAALLARALSPTTPLSSFELAEIVDHADGVPLFIEEFVRTIVAKSTGPDRIPITLRDSLMGVLDTLGKGRTVALCASVFGRRFDYAHLRMLLEFDDDQLSRAVAALIQASIFIQKGDLPEATLEFRHALLRDTAYHTLLKSERERLHRRVAELAAAGTLPIAESMPEVLATHYSLGGNYRNAIEHWLLAHSRAMRRSANVEALAHVRSGLADCARLAAADAAAAERFELKLLSCLTAPLIAISGWSTPELEDVYARAMKLCHAVGSEDTQFELERGLYNMHLLRSELRTADALAERLLVTARAAADVGRRETLLLIALRSKALPAFYGADYAAARALLEEVLALYDPIRHAGHAYRTGTEPAMLAQSYLAWIDAVDGKAASARARVARALDRARAEGHAFSIGYALCFAASSAQLLGDAEGAAEHAAQAIRVGNQHNLRYWIAWAQAVQGWVRGLEAPREGIALLDEARRSYVSTGSTLVAPYFDAMACSIAYAGGVGDPMARERELRAAAARTGVWFWEGALAGRSRL